MIRDNANHQKVLDASVNMICLCCSQKEHSVQNCPCIHFTANTEQLMNKFKYCKDQQRQQFTHKKQKKQKSTKLFNELKKTQIKIHQNTELMKEFKKGIEKQEKAQQDRNSDSCFSEDSDTETNSSSSIYDSHQGDISQKNINEVKSNTRLVIDQDEVVQKSTSNADTSSAKNKTYNNINFDDNQSKKQNKFQLLKQKSREQKQQIQNSLLISENISMHDPTENSIYQRYDDQEIAESNHNDKKNQLEGVENNLNGIDLRSLNNFNFQFEEKPPSLTYFISDSANKTIKFQEEVQNQVLIKQQQANPHSRQSISKGKRKSEYFKAKKNTLTSLSLQQEIIQNVIQQVVPKIQKQDEDENGEQKLERMQQLNEYQLLLLNKRREDINQRLLLERQSKFSPENNFFSFYTFDTQKSYRNYFPHHNLNQVLHCISQYKLKKGILLKKLFLKKSFKTKKIK